MKLKDFLLDEPREPFPKTRDGKLLVGEVELLRLVAERERASDETMQSDGEDTASTALEVQHKEAER